MDITIRFVGHGHWRISTTLRGKKIHTITTDSESIDLIKNKQRGYKTAVKFLIKKIKDANG
jgi:hypothetical protein